MLYLPFILCNVSIIRVILGHIRRGDIKRPPPNLDLNIVRLFIVANRIRYMANFVMINQPAPLHASQQFQLYSVQSDLHSGARSAAMSGCDENDDGDDRK